MAGEDGDLIEWTVRGALEAGKWSLEQLQGRFARKGVLEMPESMYEIPPKGSIDPNWCIQLYKRRQNPDAYMLTITKTAAAVAANVRITGHVGRTRPIQFIGDTEWPGEFPTLDPRHFVVFSPGIFGDSTPTFTVEWDGIDGVRREADFPIPGRFGMWGS